MEHLINWLHNFTSSVEQLIKPIMYAVWLTLVALISPIYPAFFCLFIVWVINFAMGLGEDVHANDAKFNIHKAFNSIKQLLYLAALMLLIYIVPYLMKDIGIGEKGVKYLTYIAVYFYCTNISLKATQIWPEWKLAAFLYELLSTQIFASLKNYLGIKIKNK
jgi:hypothetical protein